MTRMSSASRRQTPVTTGFHSLRVAPPAGGPKSKSRPVVYQAHPIPPGQVGPTGRPLYGLIVHRDDQGSVDGVHGDIAVRPDWPLQPRSHQGAIHELLHAIDFGYGTNLTHPQIHLLAEGISKIIRDPANRDFVRSLVAAYV